ncbi:MULTISPECIES: NAD-dependent epimerase/dehydratase family protein [Bacteria]
MSNVLILGGTGWLSGEVARRWRDAGASVTCLIRGGRPVPEGTTLMLADRNGPDAYAEAAAREWDEIVDVSSTPAHVTTAVGALAARTAHWTYVSSVSVYAAHDEVGADESAALSEPAAATTPEDEYDYSRAKAAAEASVRHGLADRAAIVRPGLIVGPGDPTDRFGYWVGRFALAASEPVLVPAAPAAMAQVVDVADVADFIVAAGTEPWQGVANAVGHPLPGRASGARTGCRGPHRRRGRGRRRMARFPRNRILDGPEVAASVAAEQYARLLDALKRGLPRRGRAPSRHPRHSRTHPRRRADAWARSPPRCRPHSS